MQRTAIVDAAVAGVTARSARSYLLRGATGIGKTTVAAQIAAALERSGRRIVPIVALAELREVPLAALAPILSAASVDGVEVSDRVHALIGLIGAAPADYVVLVDDVPLLDDVSASVLYQLVRVFGVPAVLTARDEHPLVGPVARLLHEDLVTVVEVEPLTSDEVTRLVQDHLRDSLRPESATALFRASEGNPLFLRELVLSAQRNGRVHAGPFGLELEHSRLPTHLLDAVRPRFEGLSPGALRLARLLALSQPWPELLADRTDGAALDELRRRSIVTVLAQAGRRLVRLAHPFFTEMLLDDLPTGGSDELVRSAAEALRSTGEAADRLSAAYLLADRDDPPAGELEWAAGVALAAGEIPGARRLARAARAAGAGFGAVLIEAVSASALGEEDAASAFAEATALAGGDDERALVALRHGQHLAYRLRDAAAAAALGSEVIGTLDAGAAATLAPELAKWRLMAGHAAPVVSGDGHASDPLAALSVGLGSAMFATMAGDADAARVAIAAARPHLADTATLLPHAGALLDLSEFLTEVAEGRIDEARRFAEARRVAGPPDAAGIWSYTLSLVALHGGRPEEAGALADLAVRQLEWHDFTGLVGPAIALAATAAALTGDARKAEELLARLDENALRDVKTSLQAAEAHAWLDADRGETGAAIARIADAVATALEHQHPLLAALTASTAIGLGRSADVAPLLRAAAESSPSVLVAVAAKAARISADRDHTAALDLVGSLRDSGLVAVARRMVADALRGVRDPRVRRRAQVLAGELGGLGPREGAAPRDAFALSTREWEIATAAAARMRNREIAERFGLSLRTVENHLANVYRKLGVSGRDEIAAALTDAAR